MERSYRKLFWTLALTGAIVDQLSKYSIFSWLYEVEDNRHPLITGAFDLVAQYKRVNGEIVPHVNHGALFGLAQQGENVANGVFAAISLIAAVAIIFWSFQRSTARDRSLCIALGLILAGTLGNLYDRLTFTGVRDFLHWYYLVDWPVFNIADCCLVAGAGLLLLQAFRTQSIAEDEVGTPPVLPVTVGEPGYAASKT